MEVKYRAFMARQPERAPNMEGTYSAAGLEEQMLAPVGGRVSAAGYVFLALGVLCVEAAALHSDHRIDSLAKVEEIRVVLKTMRFPGY